MQKQSSGFERFMVVWLGLFLAGTLLMASFAMPPSPSPLSKVFVTVYATGTPDSYGNFIQYVAFLQNASGSWVSTATIYNTTYTSGVVVTITANTPTRISTLARLNDTLASSSSDAQNKVRVYVTIGGVVANALSEPLGGPALSGYYYVYNDYPTQLPATSVWTPSASTNYTIQIAYQAYY